MEDILTIVNGKDKIMGWGEKSQIEYLDMSFRCVHILAILPDKTIILPKFSMSKKKFPNMVTSSAIGHVKRNENYKTAAKRCLWECLGIKKEDLKEIGNFSVDYKGNTVFHRVFSVQIVSENEIDLNPLEFQNYEKKTVETIKKEIKKGGYEYTISFKKSIEFIKEKKSWY